MTRIIHYCAPPYIITINTMTTTSTDKKLPADLAEKLGFPPHGPQPPDVRWKRALRYAKGNLGPFDLADTQLINAVAYLRRARRCRSDKSRAQLAADYPAIHAAFAIYKGEDKLLRGSLEGRLLTDQAPHDIARACNLSYETVCNYHDLFFNVRGRLQQVTWITFTAIGPKFMVGMTDEDQDVILKMAAFRGGVPLLERVHDYLKTGLKVPESLEALTVEELKSLRDKMETRALILGWMTSSIGLARVALFSGLTSELDRLIALRESGQAIDVNNCGWPLWREGILAASTGKGLEQATAKAQAVIEARTGSASGGSSCPGSTEEQNGTTTATSSETERSSTSTSDADPRQKSRPLSMRRIGKGVSKEGRRALKQWFDGIAGANQS